MKTINIFKNRPLIAISIKILKLPLFVKTNDEFSVKETITDTINAIKVDAKGVIMLTR